MHYHLVTVTWTVTITLIHCPNHHIIDLHLTKDASNAFVTTCLGSRTVYQLIKAPDPTLLRLALEQMADNYMEQQLLGHTFHPCHLHAPQPDQVQQTSYTNKIQTFCRS